MLWNGAVEFWCSVCCELNRDLSMDEMKLVSSFLRKGVEGATERNYITYKQFRGYRAIEFVPNAYKYISVDTKKAMSASFSASMWVKFTGKCDTQGICRIMSKQRRDGTGWMIHGHGGKFGFGGMTSSQHFGVSAPSGYTMHRWYHVAVTFTNGRGALYIDGASVGTMSITSHSKRALTDARQPLVLGREWDEQSPGWASGSKNLLSGRTAVNTRLMSVAAWDGVALSSEEVQAIFDGSNPEVDTQSDKLSVYIPGVEASGKVQSQSVSPDVKIRQHDRRSAAPIINTMDAAEDAPRRPAPWENSWSRPSGVRSKPHAVLNCDVISLVNQRQKQSMQCNSRQKAACTSSSYPPRQGAQYRIRKDGVPCGTPFILMRMQCGFSAW